MREGVLFEAKYSIRRVYFPFFLSFFLFPLVCTFKKPITNFEVNVNIQKGALRLKKKMTFIDVLVSSIVVI